MSLPIVTALLLTSVILSPITIALLAVASRFLDEIIVLLFPVMVWFCPIKILFYPLLELFAPKW
jgi:hypothetical protein